MHPTPQSAHEDHVPDATWEADATCCNTNIIEAQCSRSCDKNMRCILLAPRMNVNPSTLNRRQDTAKGRNRKQIQPSAHASPKCSQNQWSTPALARTAPLDHIWSVGFNTFLGDISQATPKIYNSSWGAHCPVALAIVVQSEILHLRGPWKFQWEDIAVSLINLMFGKYSSITFFPPNSRSRFQECIARSIDAMPYSLLPGPLLLPTPKHFHMAFEAPMWVECPMDELYKIDIFFTGDWRQSMQQAWNANPKVQNSTRFWVCHGRIFEGSNTYAQPVWGHSSSFSFFNSFATALAWARTSRVAFTWAKGQGLLDFFETLWTCSEKLQEHGDMNSHPIPFPNFN